MCTAQVFDAENVHILYYCSGLSVKIAMTEKGGHPPEQGQLYEQIR